MNASIEAQVMLRRNIEEQNSTLNEFCEWEKSIKQRDTEIKKSKSSLSSGKNRLTTKKVKDSYESNNATITSTPLTKSHSLIIGGQEQPLTKVPVAKAPHFVHETSTTKPHENEDEAEDTERRRGNELFSSGDYNGAIRHYTRCIELNSSSVLGYSNRSMAYLKLKDWTNAESDATSAIMIDKFHVKSYQRRSAARSALGKVRASLRDLYLAKRALTEIKMMNAATETIDDNKKDNKTLLQTCDIKARQVESELHRIIQNAPKRKVKIKIQEPVKMIDSCNQQNQYCSLDNGLEEDSMKKLSHVVEVVSRNATQKKKAFKNWIEFETLWRQQQNCSEKLELLEAMNTSNLTHIYKHGLEDSALLLDLLLCCSKLNRGGFSYLKAISQIPSIDMIVMMLNNDDKEKILSCIKTIIDTHGIDDGKIRCSFGI